MIFIMVVLLLMQGFVFGLLASEVSGDNDGLFLALVATNTILVTTIFIIGGGLIQ